MFFLHLLQPSPPFSLAFSLHHTTSHHIHAHIHNTSTPYIPYMHTLQEAMLEGKYSTCSDVWSFGMLPKTSLLYISKYIIYTHMFIVNIYMYDSNTSWTGVLLYEIFSGGRGMTIYIFFTFGSLFWCYCCLLLHADVYPDGMTGEQIKNAVLGGARVTPLPSFPKEIQKLIEWCTSTLPRNRPSFQQLQQSLSSDFSYWWLWICRMPFRNSENVHKYRWQKQNQHTNNWNSHQSTPPHIPIPPRRNWLMYQINICLLRILQRLDYRERFMPCIGMQDSRSKYNNNSIQNRVSKSRR